MYLKIKTKSSLRVVFSLRKPCPWLIRSTRNCVRNRKTSFDANAKSLGEVAVVLCGWGGTEEILIQLFLLTPDLMFDLRNPEWNRKEKPQFTYMLRIAVQLTKLHEKSREKLQELKDVGAVRSSCWGWQGVDWPVTGVG